MKRTIKRIVGILLITAIFIGITALIIYFDIDKGHSLDFALKHALLYWGVIAICFVLVTVITYCFID